MRLLSYFLAFLAVTVTLTLNIVSTLRPEWIVVRYPEVIGTRITLSYGLLQLCELKVIRVNLPSSAEPHASHMHTSRGHEACDGAGKPFCMRWSTAGYAEMVAVGCAALALFSILLGVTTHSRRRRVWKAVAGFVFLHGVLQMIGFAVVTDVYRTERRFEQGRPGIGYVMITVSWILDILVAGAVVIAGISADYGHEWARGRMGTNASMGRDVNSVFRPCTMCVYKWTG
ncbi:hypothetical protein BD779DRAFT_1505702 [Infundibulicybe gibba]|nr:hypothetical protein BD779DRAFT_1505702 [Infundibulicybe gibba]